MKRFLCNYLLLLGLLAPCALASPAAAQISVGPAQSLNPWHAYRNNVAFDPIHQVYLVIVQRPPVTGQFFDKNGAPIGGPFTIATEEGFTAWASIAFGGPANDPTFLVTYTLADLDVNPKFGRLVRYVSGAAPNISGPSFILNAGTEWLYSEKGQNYWNGQGFVVGSRIKPAGMTNPTPTVSLFTLTGQVSQPVILGDGLDYYGSPAIACAVNGVCLATGFMAGIPTGYSGGSYARLFDATSLTPQGGLFALASGVENQDQGVVYQAHTGLFLTEWFRGGGPGYIDTRLVSTNGAMSTLDFSRGIGPGAGGNSIAYNPGTRTTLITNKGPQAELLVLELGDDGYPVNPNNFLLMTPWDGAVLDYLPSLAANATDGSWLLTYELSTEGYRRRIQGTYVAPPTNEPVIVNGPTFPAATEASPYTQFLTATGSSLPYAWTHTSGALPPGVGIVGSALTGTPTTPGTYSFRLRVTGADSQFVEKDFSLQVKAIIVVPPGNAGAHISAGPPLSMNSGHAYRNNVAYDPVHQVYLVIVQRPPVTGQFYDKNGTPIGGPFTIATEEGFTAWASIAFGGPTNDPTFLVTYTLADLDVNPKFGRLVRYVPGAAPNVSGPSFIMNVGTEWLYSEKGQNYWNGQQFVVGTRVKPAGTTLPTPTVSLFSLAGQVSPPVVLGDGSDYYGSPAIACAANGVCLATGFMAGIPTGYSGGSYARLFSGSTLAPQGGLFALASGVQNEDQGVVYQAHTGLFLTEWFRGGGPGYIDTRLVSTTGMMSALNLSRGIGPGAGGNSIAYNAATRTSLLTTKGPLAELLVVELGDDGYTVNPSNVLLITPWDGAVLDYLPSLAANSVDGSWLLTYELATLGYRHVIQGTPSSQSTSLVDLNGDRNGDTFTYKASNGTWGRNVSVVGGGFSGSLGNWAAGWSVNSGQFNSDQLTDIFVFNPGTGQWFKMLNDGNNGFTTQAYGAWWPGWQRYVGDLDGDGISDIFVYDPATGAWFKCISTPTGFDYYAGAWGPGWEIYPMKLNGDAMMDLFLINRTAGDWVWVLGAGGGGFTYPTWSAWAPDWQLYPGDFNGDGLTDLLLLRPSTGQYYVALTAGSGFNYVSGSLPLGLVPHVVDLDGDHVADLFLHNKASGQWAEMRNIGGGNFVAVGTGSWVSGWDLYPTDFNADGRSDLLLYNPLTGGWFQATNLSFGSFAYFSGFWDTGLTIIVGSVVR